MTPMADEWIRKAEADFATAQREYRARRDPNYDDACFHAQQCAGAERRRICFDFPWAGRDSINQSGPAAAEERFLKPSANARSMRLRLQLAPRFPASVNAYPFTAADKLAWMIMLANPMC
jgi:hypothetical protein